MWFIRRNQNDNTSNISIFFSLNASILFQFNNLSIFASDKIKQQQQQQQQKQKII